MRILEEKIEKEKKREGKKKQEISTFPLPVSTWNSLVNVRHGNRFPLGILWKPAVRELVPALNASGSHLEFFGKCAARELVPTWNSLENLQCGNWFPR